MRNFVFFGLFVVSSLFPFPPTVNAAEPSAAMALEPFGVENQTPVSFILLPFSPDAAAVGPVGTNRIKLTTAYTSVFTEHRSATTYLYMDMELLSVSLRYDRVVAPGVEVGIQVPFLSYYGGFLDNFIENFHDTFSFPNGGRGNAPHNKVRYRIVHNGETIIDRDSGASGFGDIKFYGKFQLLTEQGNFPGISLLAQVGLPSGSESDGLGAGGPTFGAGLAVEKRWGRFALNGNGMYFHLKETDFTDPLPVRNTLAGSICAGFSFTPSFMVMAQVNGATPQFNETGGGGGLDNAVLQLLVGFACRVTTLNTLRFSFAEDLVQDTSPDFTVALEWEYHF